MYAGLGVWCTRVCPAGPTFESVQNQYSQIHWPLVLTQETQCDTRFARHCPMLKLFPKPLKAVSMREEVLPVYFVNPATFVSQKGEQRKDWAKAHNDQTGNEPQKDLWKWPIHPVPTNHLSLCHKAASPNLTKV